MGFDNTAVYDDLTRLFASTPRESGAAWRPQVVAPARRPSFASTRAVVVSGFALAVMGVGLASLVREAPAPRMPAPAVVEPRPAPARARPIVVEPLPTPARTDLVRAEPVPVPTREPVVTRAEPAERPIIRRYRPSPPPVRLAMRTPASRIVAPQPVPRSSRDIPTPHLTGVALQRALAQDVIDTRILNEEALRRSDSRTR